MISEIVNKVPIQNHHRFIDLGRFKKTKLKTKLSWKFSLFIYIYIYVYIYIYICVCVCVLTNKYLIFINEGYVYLQQNPVFHFIFWAKISKTCIHEIKYNYKLNQLSSIKWCGASYFTSSGWSRLCRMPGYWKTSYSCAVCHPHGAMLSRSDGLVWQISW